jgi:uncharacterized protein YlxW (UPF0749 family)
VSGSLGSPRSQLVVAVVTALLGFLVVVQLRAQAGAGGLATLTSQELTLLVANLNTRNDQLRTDISALERQLDDLEAGGTRGTSSINESRATLARIRAWAGLDPVQGDGIVITIRGEVSAAVLEDLVNELRNAGAEAVAIGGVRVVPGTVVGGGGGTTLSVDDERLDDPFAIRVIGAPESLTGSLTRAGGIVAQVAATHPDATLEIEPADDLVLPPTARELVPSHGRPGL